MFRIAVFIYLISFFIFKAIAMEAGDENITARCGTIYPSGVTFATPEDLEEAIRRGKGDSKHPFVGNIYQLWHTTEEGSTRTTITQIHPDIYLCCGHTADILLKANDYFKKRKYKGFKLTAKSGDTLLSDATSLEIQSYPDLTVSLAIIKLKFARGTSPACDFLPFATPITENTSNGFVVSCGDASVIGQSISSMNNARVVSIHRFHKEGKELVSQLSGHLPEEKRKEIISLTSEHSIINPKNKGDISSEKLKAIKNIIKETASFQFPIPTETNTSVRLMSALRDGASGSLLIIKQGQEKEFRILGILYKGGLGDKEFKNNKDGNIIIDPKKVGEVFCESVFLDLTPYKGWIHEQIEKFKATPLATDEDHLIDTFNDLLI